MNVHWTENATADLEAIRVIISRNSVRYARKMLSQIIKRTVILASQPQFGAVVPEYDDENLREVFEHPYRIVYSISDEQIDVLAVVHSARRLPQRLTNGS